MTGIASPVGPTLMSAIPESEFTVPPSRGYSAMLLSLPLFGDLDRDMIRDGIPGIVNAYVEEQQRRSANHEQSRARVVLRRACRRGKHRVRRKWKQKMKQPVLKYGLVGRLHSHAPSHDDGVHDPTETH